MPWTETARCGYRRGMARYASDMTDREWALIEPFMPPPRRLGRPRKTDLREVVNAILYIATTGCQWAMLTAERIRDKVRASRMNGMWMGGVPPLGYEVRDRKLIVNEADAANVRWIFERFIEIGSGTELAARGIQTSRGNRIDKKYLYRLLNNRAYIGEAVHKGDSYPGYPGEHDAIIDRAVWDKVYAILTESPRKRAARTRAAEGALFRSRRRSVLTDPHPEMRQALSILCQPDGLEARRGVVSGRPSSGR